MAAKPKEKDPFPLHGTCGLYCRACEIYQARQREDEDKIQSLSDEMGLAEEAIRCQGCGQLTARCFGRDCSIKACAEERNLRYCSECQEFPCRDLQQFSLGSPHHTDCIKALMYIKEQGPEEYEERIQKRWTCEKCGGSITWYARQCPTCHGMVLKLRRTSA